MQRVKREKRAFVKTAARGRVGSGMVTNRDLGMFVAGKRSVNLNRARGISSASVFQAVSRRPENKFIDVSQNINPAAAGTAGVLSSLLNPCAQGTDANQHIGRQTTTNSIYWNWHANMAATSVGGASLRLVIVYDKEAEGAAPTIASGAQTDIFNADNINAKMNLNNRDRFIVLVDELVECIGTAGPQVQHRKGYRKVQLPQVFNAVSTATITAINTGSIYAVVWQDGGITTAGPTTVLDTRVRFTDA